MTPNLDALPNPKPVHVYIAGPISKDPLAGARAALLEADELVKAGLTPYIPHLCVLWEMISPHKYEEWMRLGFDWLERCDAVLRIPGESKGADREVIYARALEIPVFFERPALVAWALERRAA